MNHAMYEAMHREILADAKIQMARRIAVELVKRGCPPQEIDAITAEIYETLCMDEADEPPDNVIQGPW